jgi:hypothetical protein
MSKLKFDEFFFENDKNYHADVYWNAFDTDKKTAEDKYDKHMYCPLCKTAPLTVIKGNERKYFKVINSDMEKHSLECSYRRDEASRKETNAFYADLDKSDIENRLISCMNRMLRKQKVDNKIEKTRNAFEKMIKDRSFLDIETTTREIKYLPHKRLDSELSAEDVGIIKIYYGECLLFKKIHIFEDGNKMCFIKVKNSYNNYRCDISISPYVYKYLEENLSEIPEGDEGKLYNLCFAGSIELEQVKGKNKKVFNNYKCKLKDSRMLRFEELD